MKQSRKVLLGATCLMTASAMMTGTAHADRRTGLAGNLLIEDPDDLFPFPQLALKHRNIIRLDYGANQSSGNGVLTMGNEKQSFGIALHRGDVLSPDVVGFGQELVWLTGVGDPFGGRSSFAAPQVSVTQADSDPTLVAATPAVLPTTVVDLVYARAMGDNALGVRFGFGRGVQSLRSGDTRLNGSQTFFAGQFGYSILPPQGLRVDLSGNAVVAFGKSTLSPGTGVEVDPYYNKGFDLRVGALGRAYYPINELVDLGFLGQLSVNNTHGKNDPNDVKSNYFDMGLMAGVGPNVKLDRAKLAAYGGAQLGLGKLVPDSDVAVGDRSYLNFAAPMVNMAVEVQLLDWLFVRTGAQYTWNLDRDKHAAGADPDDAITGGDDLRARTSRRFEPFRWSFGLGLMKNNFYFDAVVQNALLLQGPNFIGGNATGFLAMASATYKFGDIFGPGANEPARKEPEPAPQAATYEPAPEQERGVVEPAAAVEADGDARDGSVEGEARAGGSLSIGN